jgi:hypothetical protein
MADKPEVPKRGNTLAAQLLQQLDRTKNYESESEWREKPPVTTKPQAAAALSTKQPQSEQVLEGTVESSTEPETDPTKTTSAVAQSITVQRGPSAICFIYRNRYGRKQRKIVTYATLPEWELNDEGTVLVLQFTSANVELRGRNLVPLEREIHLGRTTFVHLADSGDFNPLEGYVTDILFHLPQPGTLEWSEKGEYLPYEPEPEKEYARAR